MPAIPDQDRCPECGGFNPRTNLLCKSCSARLPWADALEQERRQQRAGTGQTPAASGLQHQTAPWAGSTGAASPDAAQAKRYAAIQRSLWRLETLFLVLILLVGWIPVAIVFAAKAKAGTKNVCEVCGKAGLPLVYGRVPMEQERNSAFSYDADEEKERSARDIETLYYCPQHFLAAPTKVTNGKYDIHDKGKLTFLVTFVATFSCFIRLAQRRGLYEVVANTKWWELIRKELLAATCGLLILAVIIYTQYGPWIQTLLR